MEKLLEISYIAKGYAKANNKYMEDCNPKKPSNTYCTLKCITCMVGQWVVQWFKYLKSVDRFDVNAISEKSPIGYIIEAHLECPEYYTMFIH